jgi:hypothetical protein
MHLPVTRTHDTSVRTSLSESTGCFPTRTGPGPEGVSRDRRHPERRMARGFRTEFPEIASPGRGRGHPELRPRRFCFRRERPERRGPRLRERGREGGRKRERERGRERERESWREGEGEGEGAQYYNYYSSSTWYYRSHGRP